jgi:hypothetical protein
MACILDDGQNEDRASKQECGLITCTRGAFQQPKFLTTLLQAAKMQLKFNDGNCVTGMQEVVMGTFPHKMQGDTLTADLGSIRFG